MADLAVVMATYDGARWLPEQLASIAGQTRPPDVLIVSDDGSTDSTMEVVDAFARTARFPVEVRQGPGRGVGDNFWSAATSCGDVDLIAWCDQDDVWHPDKLAACERAMAEGDAAFVSHTAQVVDGDLTPREGHRCPDYGEDALLAPLQGDPWHVPSGFASVFRRSLLDDIPWEDRPPSHMTARRIIHDHAISLRAFSSARRAHLARPLAMYRQHGANVHGDPTPHGLGSLRTALGVGAPEFRRLASRARGYGAYTAALPGADPGTAAYFDALARRCDDRADVYDARGVVRRGRSAAAAARRGVYSARGAGGFGALALAKDAVDIGLRAVSRPPRAAA